MAKRVLKAVKKSEPVEQAAEAVNEAIPSGGAVEQKLTAYAEALGTAIGNMRGKMDGWNKERAHLADQLSKMVSDAQQLLSDLGHATSDRVARMRGKKKVYKQPESNPAGAMKRIKPKAQRSTARVTAMAADKPHRAPQIKRKILN